MAASGNKEAPPPWRAQTTCHWLGAPSDMWSSAWATISRGDDAMVCEVRGRDRHDLAAGAVHEQRRGFLPGGFARRPPSRAVARRHHRMRTLARMRSRYFLPPLVLAQRRPPAWHAGVPGEGARRSRVGSSTRVDRGVARASARRRASTAASRPRAEERARRRCATAPSMSCRHTKRHDTRKDVDTRGICSAVQAASANLAQTFDFQRTVLYCMRS